MSLLIWDVMNLKWHHCNAMLWRHVSGIVGDACAVDADCYDAFQNSSCTSGTCQCDMGYYSSTDGSQCVASEEAVSNSLYIYDVPSLKRKYRHWLHQTLLFCLMLTELLTVAEIEYHCCCVSSEVFPVDTQRAPWSTWFLYFETHDMKSAITII